VRHIQLSHLGNLYFCYRRIWRETVLELETVLLAMAKCTSLIIHQQSARGRWEAVKQHFPSVSSCLTDEMWCGNAAAPPESAVGLASQSQHWRGVPNLSLNHPFLYSCQTLCCLSSLALSTRVGSDICCGHARCAETLLCAHEETVRTLPFPLTHLPKFAYV